MDVVVGTVFHRVFGGEDVVLVFSLADTFINPIGQVFVICDAHRAVGVAHNLAFHDDTAVGVAFALIGDEIAQRIGRNTLCHTIFVLVFQRNRLHHMWMSADDHVRATLVHVVGIPLLSLILFPLVLDAPVRHHHDVVGLEFAGAGDITGDGSGI